MKLASYLIVRVFKYNIKYSVYFKGIYGLIIMGGTTVMMKKACILFILRFQYDSVNRESENSSNFFYVMERQQSININHFSINEGMTYTEVKDLIGFEGDLLIEEG